MNALSELLTSPLAVIRFYTLTPLLHARHIQCVFMLVFLGALFANAGTKVDLRIATEVTLRQKLGQLRAAPVDLGERQGLVLAYGEDRPVDPYHEMFFYPEGTLKIAVVDLAGNLLWSQDLGRGTPPGRWFSPVFPFDLDQDGEDEIWCVQNLDTEHPFALSGYKLLRRDAKTGETTGTWPWPKPIDKSLAHMFRNFILGGMVNGEPVLVTAQGTYEGMKLQGWNPDMSLRWEHVISKSSDGARGSHMCPVVDFDEDGREEVLWGERLIEIDTGEERFCADRDSYRGHSDIIQPFFSKETGRWSFFTCREKDLRVAPRIAVFDDKGNRRWGALEEGHIDTGWVAHLDSINDFVAVGVRIDRKTRGPDGLVHQGVECFAFDADDGSPRELPFDPYGTLPVDLNGDGRHELVYGLWGADGTVIDAEGRVLGNVGGEVAFVGKLLDRPGEHIVSFRPDGTLQIWYDARAEDSERAKWRYAHAYYRANRRLSASATNRVNLGGL